VGQAFHCRPRSHAVGPPPFISSSPSSRNKTERKQREHQPCPGSECKVAGLCMQHAAKRKRNILRLYTGARAQHIAALPLALGPSPPPRGQPRGDTSGRGAARGGLAWAVDKGRRARGGHAARVNNACFSPLCSLPLLRLRLDSISPALPNRLRRRPKKSAGPSSRRATASTRARLYLRRLCLPWRYGVGREGWCFCLSMPPIYRGNQATHSKQLSITTAAARKERKKERSGVWPPYPAGRRYLPTSASSYVRSAFDQSIITIHQPAVRVFCSRLLSLGPVKRTELVEVNGSSDRSRWATSSFTWLLLVWSHSYACTYVPRAEYETLNTG
jgi:hypothetical protein